MKLYDYKGKKYTIDQLAKHKDCKVSEHDLRRNIWRKKLKPEVAFCTPIQKRSKGSIEKYFYMGINMTTAELTELDACTASYWQLRALLRKGIPVEYAIKNKDITKDVPTVAPKATTCRMIDSTPKGGCISFTKPTVREDMSYTYEWLVLEKLGFVMQKSGMNLEKTIDKIIERDYDNNVIQ
jgi:hypothetical protein